MKKICPMMSTPEKTVLCTEECAWYQPEGQITRQCAIFRIVDSIDFSGVHFSEVSEENSEG